MTARTYLSDVACHIYVLAYQVWLVKADFTEGNTSRFFWNHVKERNKGDARKAQRSEVSSTSLGWDSRKFLEVTLIHFV